MVLKYVISKNPTLLEDMEVIIWEAQSDTPGAEVFTQTIPERLPDGTPSPGAGHQTQYTLVANGLDKVVHIVRLYAKVSGTLLHEYNAEPDVDLVIVFDPIYFKIGDGGPHTPAAGDTAYSNPDLAGLVATDYTVHRNNYGYLFFGTHIDNDPLGGFAFVDPADQFGANEEFLIQQMVKKVTTVVNDSVVGKWFAGFVDVAANTVYDATHLRKLIRFSGSPEYDFNVSPPIGYGAVFQHFGADGTAKINFNNGNLLWGGAPKAFIDFPKYTEGCFTWDGANWNVVYLTQTRDTSKQPGDILGCGKMFIGDVPAGDITYTINHGLNIVGDYAVFLSNRAFNSVSAPFDNNVVEIAWYPHETDGANKFKICIREDAPSLQNLTICYLIIQL